jgi:anti-anti-sigma factor
MSTDINSVDVSENFRRISISGRLDILGSDAIALKFTSLAVATERRVVVDLTAVSFLASIGIRAIISNAKALQQRGGKMVLFVGNNAAIAKTLEATGIDALIPMFADADASDKAALA